MEKAVKVDMKVGVEEAVEEDMKVTVEEAMKMDMKVDMNMDMKEAVEEGQLDPILLVHLILLLLLIKFLC